MPRRPEGLTVAVTGASSLLGTELLRILQSEAFPVVELRPIADAAELDPANGPDDESEGSARSVEYLEEDLPLIPASPEAFEGCDVAFLAGSAEQAGRLAKLSFPRVALTVDLSGRFAASADVPLILPDVNPAEIAKLPAEHALVAVPDAATAILAMALAPIAKAAGIARAIVSTYEAASGAGRAGMDELGQQIRDLFNYKSPDVESFPRSLAFNCIPQVDDLAPEGETTGERRMIDGVARLLGKPVPMLVTRAWVPVFSGHSAAITIDTERPIDLAAARAAIADAPGMGLTDDPTKGDYPVNGDTIGSDVVSAGRLRVSNEGRTLTMWIAGDNLRRGGALAAVRLAEAILDR